MLTKKHRARPSAVAALSALILSSCSPAPTSAPTTVEPVAGGQLTPLLDSTLWTPRWFTGTDAQTNLVYELLLTNVVPTALTLNTVEVYDADSGASLISLTGDSPRSATSLAASAQTPTLLLPASSLGVVWLDIPLGDTPCRPRSPIV